jgi:hypothetical protein
VAGLPSRAVGLITQPALAEAIVAEGRADLIALGRAILADPRWPVASGGPARYKILPAGAIPAGGAHGRSLGGGAGRSTEKRRRLT